jgi:hypothetical protein
MNVVAGNDGVVLTTIPETENSLRLLVTKQVVSWQQAGGALGTHRDEAAERRTFENWAMQVNRRNHEHIRHEGAYMNVMIADSRQSIERPLQSYSVRGPQQ